MLQILSVILTVLFPIPSLIYNFTCFIFLRDKRKFFAIMSAISFACMAYVWNPGIQYDLYRHHQETASINIPLLEFVAQYSIFDEPGRHIIEYIISCVHNLNILQFMIVFIGYFEVLFMIADIAKHKESSRFTVGVITTAVLLSLGFIDFSSGLFFYFSTITFAFAYYLEKYRGTKIVHWVMYFVAPLIHTATFYLLLLYLVTKFLKINKKVLIISISILSLLIGPVIVLLYENISSGFVEQLYHFYTSYILNGAQYDSLHSGNVLVFAIYRLIACLLIYILFVIYAQHKKDERQQYVFEPVCILSILAILPTANVYIRYAFFAQLIMLPILFEFFEQKKIVSLCTLMPIILYGTYSQANQIYKSDIGIDIQNNAGSSIVELKNENGGML